MRFHASALRIFERAQSKRCYAPVASRASKFRTGAPSISADATRIQLAAKADKSPNTIARFERGEDMRRETIAEIRTALELGGVEFVAENEASSAGGAGVRLAKPKRKKSR
jgi:hypothetical protein